MSRAHSGGLLRARSVVAVRSDDLVSASAEAPLPDTSWRQHLDWLREAVRRRFGAQLADDITHEAYLRVVRREDGAVDNPRGLLMTVASNLARDNFRRERVRADHATAVEHMHLSSPLGGHTAEEDFQVREAIRALPPKLRDVLLLSKIGGLTNREIAQRYGLSVRAIDKRLQKAITLFVARLRD